MPHAAVIAAAATMGVAAIGAAIAFELQVFRPWREENYPEGLTEGIAEEMRSEWNEFKDDLKRGFSDIRERVRNEFSNPSSSSNNEFYERFQDDHDQQQRREDAEEMLQVQSDLDEFELNDRQNQAIRRPWQDDFATDQSMRKRRPLRTNFDANEDQILNHKTTATTTTLFNEDLDSPHHNLGFDSPISNSQKSLVTVNETPNLIQQGEDVPQSPNSDHHQISLHSNTISDDEEWFSRASSPIRINHEDEGMDSGNVSDAWIQLENSPPGTPTTSASWSAIDRENQSHLD